MLTGIVGMSWLSRLNGLLGKRVAKIEWYVLVVKVNGMPKKVGKHALWCVSLSSMQNHSQIKRQLCVQ